ncbi:hypothetical protein AB4Z46_28125 [Variovorax sp. M-6]|uniref:hypothetical protein n=1 Tax=Variovorax sp. M-6 TaxID=3233041 RepID=UPI003F955A82
MPKDDDFLHLDDLALGRHLSDIFANRRALNFVQSGLFRRQPRQATQSTPVQSRSESVIAINPLNEQNMIGASKKFIDPAKYRFKLGPIYTFDAGLTWHESQLPLQNGWDGMTDPTVAFDDFGNAFLVGEPLRFDPTDLTGLGMAVYRSSDGGITWQPPMRLTTDTTDDKQWVLCDNNATSPYRGNVYVVWAASSPLRFARSTDHGATWKGKGGDPPGSTLVSYAFAPDISIASDGTLHIFWHDDASSTIKSLRSTDGGATFEPQHTVVDGVVSLRGHLPITHGWPHFDHAKFRVMTIVSSCAAPGKVVVVTWADMREGRSRIYFRCSRDNGLSWDGPAAGQALLPNVSYGDSQCFHPSVACTSATGIVGCSFYVLGNWFGNYLINVQLAASWDFGASFNEFADVTDQPWDPLVNAPFSHGDPDVHFIGEYFGMDAGGDSFALLWTDTRTGVQELFSNVVSTKRIRTPHIPDLVAQILAGVVQDGGGWVLIGGKLHRVPPRGPINALLEALAERHELETTDISTIEATLRQIAGR